MVVTMIILLILLLIVLLGSFYAYFIAFYAPKSKRADLAAPLVGEQYNAVAEHIDRIVHIMARCPYEAVTVRAFDGTELYGRYYHVRDGAPLEILFHGYRSHPYRDCSGGHALSRKMGFNALVVDQRAHGQSGSNTICFGIKERHDVQTWVNYANARFGAQTPVILSGLSMGAATVLMASNLNLSENVCAIIADSPYSAPCAILEKVAADEHYPVALVRPFMKLGARIYGGFNLTEVTAKQAVAETRIPILLIHGEADHFVPCEMSREIAARCASTVDVQTFPDAGHGLCYMVDPKRYERVVYDFLRVIPALSGTISDAFVQQLFEF